MERQRPRQSRGSTGPPAGPQRAGPLGQLSGHMCNAGPGAVMRTLEFQPCRPRPLKDGLPARPAQAHMPSSKQAAGGLHRPSGLERRAAGGGEAAAETLMKDILRLPAGSQAQPRQRDTEQGADRRRGPCACALRSPEQGQSGASSSLASQWEASQHLCAGGPTPPRAAFLDRIGGRGSL